MTTKLTKNNFSSLNTIGISWQSVITADGSTSTNAIAGQGYFIDTTSAAHTINLPSSPSIGDSIAITDYAGTFGTNNLTITRNGNNIQGVANDSVINTNRASIVLVYIDATKGWLYAEESNVNFLGPLYITATGGTVTTSGDFKIHTFTGDGCFVVSQTGSNGGPSNVDYLIVAGGGGGGHAGGGGAGGYRTTFPSPGCNAGIVPITTTTYPITVGAGGAGRVYNSSNPTPGSPSTGVGYTSTGGGAGGSSAVTTAAPGGSGGGNQSSAAYGGPSAIGSGNTPPVSPPQGNNGGAAPGGTGGGGGGGASAVGGDSPGGTGGVGGAGSSNSITGSAVNYAGGGGGGGDGAGAGGSGGGGAGGSGNSNGTNGTANTGGGGGGIRILCGLPGTAGGAGGKGIVIIRYKYQ